MSEGAHNLRVGEEFRGYRIESLLGRGGLSSVYRASDPRGARRVALKIYGAGFAQSPRTRDAFLAAMRDFAALDHPNLLPVYDAGAERGELFVVMPVVEGVDLRALMTRERQLAPARLLAIFEQMAAGLDTASAHGFLHGDLKPANVMIEGPTEHVYVVDFATDVASGIGHGSYIGTLDYSAPEQIEGNQPIGQTADVYSFTCIVYECLTGSAPYERDSDVAIMFAHMTEPPPRPSLTRPDLPEELDAVIAHGMAKGPEERFTTCGDLVAELRACLPTEGPALGRHRVRTRGDLLADARRIFVSYSAREREAAEAVCGALEKAGFKCWIAPRDVPPGAPWATSIIAGIDESFMLVLVLSKSALASQQVMREIAYAGDRNLPIIPLRIEDVRPSGAMTYYLGPKQWLDAFPGPVEERLEPLVAAARTTASG